MRIIQHSNRRNSEKFTIEYEVYFSRTDRLFISTGVKVDKKYWDDKTRSVKITHPEFSILNLQIKTLHDRIISIGERYYKKGETLTGELLKSELAYDKPTLVNDYIAEQIEFDKQNLEYSTYRRLKSFLSNLNQFRVFTFMQCDTALLREYHMHLLKTMKATSTSKNHKPLSKYLSRAVIDGLLPINPYKSFKIPSNTERKIYLTEDELNLIRNKNNLVPRLQQIKDRFLFLCNTGMEFADQDQLLIEDIVSIKGKKYIVKDRVKIDNEVQAIPLFDEALRIVDKYNSTDTGKVFPKLSNQNFNSYLKELADCCGINKNLTTIVARHTFATIMLNNGMPLESVSHIMGHASTKTTKKNYAKFIVSKIANDLERLNIAGV